MRFFGWAIAVAVCVVLCTSAAKGLPVDEEDASDGGTVKEVPKKIDDGVEENEIGLEEDGNENVGETEEIEGVEEQEDGNEDGEEDLKDKREAEGCEVLGEVQNLILTQNGDLLTAIWDKPLGSGNCEITYKITFADGVRALTAETIANYYEFAQPLVPCSEVDVTVTPVSTSGEGITVSGSILAATRIQTAPYLFNITSSCNTLQTTWVGETFEENKCEATHFQLLCLSDHHSFSFSQSINDNTYRVFEIKITWLEPDTFYTCNGFVFVTEAGFSPPSETLEFTSNLDVIPDLVIAQTESGVAAQWTPPVNSEECGVVYEVVIDNQDIGTRTEVTEDLTVDLNIPSIPCSTTTVTVTPIANTEGRGESKTVTYVNQLSDVNPVQGLQIENNLVTWNQPVGLGRCVVSFLVAHSNNLGTQEIRTSESNLEISLVPCSWNVIKVSAVFGDRVSTAQEATATVGAVEIGNVRDVTFNEEGNRLNVTWGRPYGDFGVCEVSYVIYQVVSAGLLTFQTNETEQYLLFIGCTESEIRIFAVIEGVPGTISTFIYKTSISNIGPVTNLQLTSSRVQWTQPVGIGNCVLSYRLTVEDNFNQRELISEGTSADLDYIPCSDLTVTVAALNGLAVGASASVEGVAPAAAPAAPLHVLTAPSFSGANVTLQANSLSDNFCTLTQASVQCVDYNQIATTLLLNIADDESRQFTLNINNLQPDHIYTCTAAWLTQSTPLQSALSEPIVFRTVPLEAKNLVISDVTSDGFLVSWNEPYGSEFVVSYNVLIGNLGPNFFIPEGCPQPERGDHNVLLDLQEYDFNNGLPDTNYEVKVITTYTLGSAVTSDVKGVNTLPGVPEAPVGLQAFWRYGLGQTYNVSADLTWELPCNVNGALSHFDVSVTTFAQVGSRNVEYEDTREVVANDPIDDTTYGFILADMNPFFTYLVSVKAVGGLAGPAETLYVQPPSACTCPSADSP